MAPLDGQDAESENDCEWTEEFTGSNGQAFKIPIPSFARPFPRFRLRIFASVDIVGSTAFKQARVGGWRPMTENGGGDSIQGQAWLPAFAGFFGGIQNHFIKAWQQAGVGLSDDEKLYLDIAEPPRFWKAIGDEVIYTKEIKNNDQALLCVMAFIDAIDTYRPLMKMVSPSLDMKATAWLAGFPINNAEFVLGPERDDLKHIGIEDDYGLQHYLRPWLHRYNKKFNKNERLDYVGPQMDLGFRLSSLSTPRRMPLSADLAYIIADSLESNTSEYAKTVSRSEKVKFGFRGMEILKGVTSGEPYPVFWVVSKNDTLADMLDELEEKSAYMDRKKVLNFCKCFLDNDRNSDEWLMVPFVASDGNYQYTEIARDLELKGSHFVGTDTAPSKHERYLKDLQQTFRTLLLRSIETYRGTFIQSSPGNNALMKKAEKNIDVLTAPARSNLI